MINWLTVICSIFVYQRKCGARYIRNYTQLFADGFDKCGFASSHLSADGHNRMFAVLQYKSSRFIGLR